MGQCWLALLFSFSCGGLPSTRLPFNGAAAQAAVQPGSGTSSAILELCSERSVLRGGRQSRGEAIWNAEMGTPDECLPPASPSTNGPELPWMMRVRVFLDMCVYSFRFRVQSCSPGDDDRKCTD